MSGDPRRTTSSRHTNRPNEEDDLTWLDYLRTAGGTVPTTNVRPPPTAGLTPSLDRQNSSERKRRHTGTEGEQQRRNYPYPNYDRRPSDARMNNSSSMNVSGSAADGGGRQIRTTMDTAINLTSPPRLSSRPSFSRTRQASDGSMGRRRESDMLPKWQPDTEADKCPVCKTVFSFWFRKHHCRKCGRVVCSNCSPHRITIPRQYIVQPPNPYFEDEANSASPPGSRGNPALGGGEVVRVCNPCVPDPWTPDAGPPATREPPAPPRTTPASIPSDENLSVASSLRRADESRRRPSGERERPERYRTLPTGPSARNRSATHQPMPSSGRGRWEVPTAAFLVPSTSGRPSQDGPYPRLGARYHRHSVSTEPNTVSQRHASRPPSSLLTEMAFTARAMAPPDSAPRPRREVREEDECPVCGIELPPNEDFRQGHIMGCIEARSYSTPTQQPPPNPPSANTASIATPADMDSISTSASSSATPPPVSGIATQLSQQQWNEASRPRAQSHRSRGMALYRATEKDCLDASGDPQECVICFEEFQPGDEMGRMECLCKFHRLCIRQWWDTKGAGSCPTHQLHD